MWAYAVNLDGHKVSAQMPFAFGSFTLILPGIRLPCIPLKKQNKTKNFMYLPVPGLRCGSGILVAYVIP